MSKNQILYEKLTKAQEESLTLIQSLGIYELRALARVFGDTSPTTSKRNDHIKIVMDKIISGENIKPIPLRQGRPYKELSNIESILEELSAINGKNYTLKNNRLNQQKPSNVISFKDICFKQNIMEDLKSVRSSILAKGIVLKNDEGNLYIINEDNNLPALILNEDKNNIEKYDFITGSAKLIDENKNVYVMTEIDTINFEPKSSYTPSFIDASLILPKETLNIFNTDVKLGGRYVLEQSKFDNINELKLAVNKLKENDVICLALVANAMFEDKILLNSVEFNNVFTINYDATPQNYADKVDELINLVTKLHGQGKSVAVFVKDILTIAHTLDANNKEITNYFNHSDKTVETIKELVMLAKACEKFSTTLFVTYDEREIFDPLYSSIIYKVSKKI